MASSLPLALTAIFPSRRRLEELDPPPWVQRLWIFCLCGGMFAFFAQATAFFPILPVYLTARWGATAPVGLVVGAMAAGVLMLRPLIGIALDRWGRKPLLVLGLVTALWIQPLYLLAPSPEWLLPVRILHGLSQAGVATGSQTFLADLVPPERRAAMMGYLAMANTLGFAFGPWLGNGRFLQLICPGGGGCALDLGAMGGSVFLSDFVDRGLLLFQFGVDGHCLAAGLAQQLGNSLQLGVWHGVSGFIDDCLLGGTPGAAGAGVQPFFDGV